MREKKMKKAADKAGFKGCNLEVVNKKLHQNPWPYMAGVGFASLLTGFVIGNKGRNM